MKTSFLLKPSESTNSIMLIS